MSEKTVIDAFTTSYIVCALWSSTDDPEACRGEHLDDIYGLADISMRAIAQMTEDCATFQFRHGAKLARAYAAPGYTPERAGHDFWLTRNGHGAGFWDRGLGGLGDELTSAAKMYGGCDLYVGDDGKIHS